MSCENAAIRQSSDGLFIYNADGRTEMQVDRARGGRIAELKEIDEAIVNDRQLFHDGNWGMATLEVCFAILESARTGAEITMKHQIPI